MKKIILLAAICIITVKVFSQGSGEITVYPNHFYHGHQNYGEIKNLTIKWNFRTLFGEPVIDGVFKWEAGSNTPSDFLDYRDYVLLKCAPVKMSVANGHILSFYIAVTPTVPRAGEGYGFNTPGSPSWNDVFIHSLWEKRQGENKYRLDINYLPYKTVGDYAKAIWKGGFKVIDAELVRAGGLDADKTTKSNSSSDNDVRNAPENTTTQNDLKQREAIDRQKQLTQQAKDKYKALKKPYILNIINRDTVSEASLQLLKAINPYFQNGILALSSVSNGKVISKANTVNVNLQLAEGWNTLRIALKGENYNLKDSLRVYYKKDGRFGRMTDQQGNVYKTVKIGNQVWMAENLRTTIYNDGSEILNISNNEAWHDAKEGAYCNYKNNESYKNVYGHIYNYWAIRTNILAPKGWHIPSVEEWENLINFLGGNNVTGTKLKEVGITHWNNSNVQATNETGFTAVPAGARNNDGVFGGIFDQAAWWCFNGQKTGYLSYYSIRSDSQSLNKNACYPEVGMSIRCIKDK